MLTGRNEDYLETLLSIIEKKNYAQVKDVSRILEVSPASVTGMFRKLREAGYINYEKYGGVTLTTEGERIARETQEKHDILRQFLEILGVASEIADEDACRIEHTANPETMDRLTRFVDFVQASEDRARWLDHFKYFYETGEYIECCPGSDSDCPVHGSRPGDEATGNEATGNHKQECIE